jgi:hypothetical protein
MNSRKHIQEELTELKSLLPLEKGPEVFSVPQGYFDGFAASVLQKLKGEIPGSVSEELGSIYSLLAGISKKMPFTVPENYFTTNTEGLSDLVSEEVIPDFLQGGKQLPYSVPAGYFENLPQAILRKVNPGEAKVIPISSSRKWMRYAAAAIITGIIAISSVLYFGNNQSVDPASQPGEWVAKKLKNVPDKEIDDFINTADVSTTAIAKSESDKTEVRKLLKDIPVNELEKFLDEVPIDNEDLLIIN